jgi:hypothetical protein
MTNDTADTRPAGDDEPVNPFDPESFRADPGDDDIPTKRITHHIDVRKPRKPEFFRVHPDPTFCTEVFMIEAGGGVESDKYLVEKSLAHEVVRECTRRRLYLCVNRGETPFIWPAKMPVPSNPTNSWLDTALDVAESAKHHWVRMIPDLDARQYEESRALEALEEPKWPEESFAELLAKAFKKKLITDYDHEVLRALRGEI